MRLRVLGQRAPREGATAGNLLTRHLQSQGAVSSPDGRIFRDLSLLLTLCAAKEKIASECLKTKKTLVAKGGGPDTERICWAP